MKATAKNGDVWTGERDGHYWIYQDANGNLYESSEVPAYRIRLNATQQIVSGKLTITPLATSESVNIEKP